MAPPRKRPASPPASDFPRKSARLSAAAEGAAGGGAALAAQSAGSIREQSIGLSVLSTNTESSETWLALEEEAKTRIAEYKSQGLIHEEKLQPGLKAFVEWLPEGGRESVARDIIQATTDKDLYDVFYNLFTGLAVPITASSKISSVTSSPHPKRENNVDIVASTLNEPETRHPQFRASCLRRDRYCCVVTGAMDTTHWKELSYPENISQAPLEAVHIIPFSYASWNKKLEPPNDTSSAWEVLWRCFPNVRKVGMQVESINNLSNGISLVDHVHTQFAKFHIAFKPTNRENVYKLKVFKLYPSMYRNFLPKDGHIEFKRAEDAQDLELPGAALLDCHYRIAEILNASGMAEFIERHLRDWEDIKGCAGSSLKEDGTTDIGRILSTGLWERVGG